jgi:hypothetical protein
MKKVVSKKKKGNMWRLLTLHPAGARVGMVGMDIGVVVRWGEVEVDGMRMGEGEGEEIR